MQQIKVYTYRPRFARPKYLPYMADKSKRLYTFFYGILVYCDKMSTNTQIIQTSSNVTFFNITASPRDDRDMNVDMIFEPPLVYPRSLDWTKHLQEVRNQGVQGTSLAHAGACILEWRETNLCKKRKYWSAICFG